MWVVMMAAMMLPSLVPMLSRYRRTIGGAENLGGLTALVGAGYFLVWSTWGIAAFPLGVALVSKPGRCFTKQTGDMVYTMAENSWLSQLWLDARRCVYALERDSNRGPTPTVFIELSEGRDVCDRSLPRVRHFAPDCL
jgi:hypothetical protein